MSYNTQGNFDNDPNNFGRDRAATGTDDGHGAGTGTGAGVGNTAATGGTGTGFWLDWCAGLMCWKRDSLLSLEAGWLVLLVDSGVDTTTLLCWDLSGWLCCTEVAPFARRIHGDYLYLSSY